MPAPAAGAKTVLFGNVRAAYVIRDVRDTQLLTFRERFGDYLQVAWTAFHRSDALVQDAAAVGVLQQAAV